MNDEEKVLNALVDEEISLCNSEYEIVVFSGDLLDNLIMYTWRAKHNRQSRRSIDFTYPWQNSSEIKYFKTLNGAKRNFIREGINKGGVNYENEV